MSADALQDFTQFAPPAVAAQAMRLLSRLRIADRVNSPVNVVISNVPGPNHPLYSAGAELKHFYPVSTISDGIGLNLTVQSYNGQLDFGFVGDRELVPDLWILVDLLHDAMRELHGRAMAENDSTSDRGAGRRSSTTCRRRRQEGATKKPATKRRRQSSVKQPRRRRRSSGRGSSVRSGRRRSTVRSARCVSAVTRRRRRSCSGR